MYRIPVNAHLSAWIRLNWRLSENLRLAKCAAFIGEIGFPVKHKLARVVAGLHVANEDQCPLLVAEQLARQAENSLVEAMSESTNLSADILLSAGLDQYKQFIELTLKLLAPYVRNVLSTSH